MPHIVRSEEDDSEVEAIELNLDEDEDYDPEEQRPAKKQKVAKKPITQAEVDNIIRLLQISAEGSEVMGSWLKRRANTELSFRVIGFRKWTARI